MVISKDNKSNNQTLFNVSKNPTAFIIVVYVLPISFGLILLFITILFGCCIKKVVINGKKVWVCREKPKKTL